MAGFDLPPSLSAESWNSKAAGLDKSKSAARTALGNDLKALQSQTRLVRWDLLDIDKLSVAKEMDDRLKDIDAEKRSALDKLGKQLAAIVKSADACSGKDIDKKAAEALKAIKADAGGQRSAMEARFNAALAALTQKLKTVPKPAAKAPAPAPAASAPGAARKAAAMAKTYRKLGLEAIVKARTKPQMKPSRFMVAEFKKSVLFYMGMKYDKAKTTEVLKAMNPGDTFVRTYVDPNSKVIWEKGALTLVSNRIQPKFATRMTRSSKLILGKTMKIRMRTETGEADEPEGVGEEMSEAELNAELAKMAGDPEVESDEDDVSADTIDDDEDAPAAKAPAKPSAAAPPVSPALVNATRKWATTRSSAKKEIDGLFEEIGKLYGAGQEAQLASARKTLDGCMAALAKLDKELAALIATKDKEERTKKTARARSTADQLIEFVRSNKVMANLDKNEVREISAAAKLSSSLAEIKAALA